MPFFSRAKTSYGGFYAVFLPTFLMLVSMGFFLRIGLILATAGPLRTLTIITFAVSISLITALSISCMVTNIKIESGSVFFLLSRSFGIEIGSAISLPLFLAQALSVSFYCMGFGEVLHLLIPTLSIQEITFGLLVLITLLAIFSSKIVLKTQLIMFLCICLTFVSFYCGYSNTAQTAHSVKITPLPFWTLFGLFFPIVTGIEGSLSFIHQLKNPARSIPLGLLSAIVCAFILYLITAYNLYTRASSKLLCNPLVMKELSRVPLIVVIGILGSTLSAALASLISAANSLKGFAEDGIIPKVLGHPVITILFSIMIAFLGVSFGDITTISPILSMFFLISYGMLNTATGVEALIQNPSWRPTLKTPWMLSLSGAALCLIVMLLIDPSMCLIATAAIFLLYLLMKKRQLRSSWEDMTYSILLFFSRGAIYTLSKLQPSPKTWRPNLLVFVGDPLLKAHLIDLTSAITHKKGFLIFSSIITPSYAPKSTLYEEQKLSLFLDKLHIPALVRTKEAPNLLTGMKSLIEDIGVGRLYPNTIVLGVSDKPEKIAVFAEIIQFAYKNKKNLILIRENGLMQRLHIKKTLHQKKLIDVWWGGRSKHNSELMLIMAYMLQTSESWKGSVLTLKTAVNMTSDIAPMQGNLETFLNLSRLHLKTDIALHETGDVFSTTMKKNSSSTDLVFLGMRPPEEESLEEYSQYYVQLLEKTKGYPPIAYTLAGETLNFTKILS